MLRVLLKYLFECQLWIESEINDYGSMKNRDRHLFISEMGCFLSQKKRIECPVTLQFEMPNSMAKDVMR